MYSADMDACLPSGYYFAIRMRYSFDSSSRVIVTLQQNGYQIVSVTTTMLVSEKNGLFLRVSYNPYEQMVSAFIVDGQQREVLLGEWFVGYQHSINDKKTANEISRVDDQINEFVTNNIQKFNLGIAEFQMLLDQQHVASQKYTSDLKYAEISRRVEAAFLEKKDQVVLQLLQSVPSDKLTARWKRFLATARKRLDSSGNDDQEH